MSSMKVAFTVPAFLYFIQLTSCRIILEDFYPYGPSNGDASLPRNDDDFVGPIPIAFHFPYFGTDYDSTYVSI